MDGLSRETLRTWQDKEHHLGRAGVRRATCTLEIAIAGPEGVPRTTRGALLWDGRSARTRWDDEELVGAADYDVNDWCESWFGSWWNAPHLRDVRLWAKRNADGGVTIEFTDADDEPYSLRFDSNNVLAEAAWGTGTHRRTERYTHGRRGGRWVLEKSETREADGTLVCRAEIRHETVAGRLVPASMRITHACATGDATGGEVSELRFTDWKLDDDAK